MGFGAVQLTVYVDNLWVISGFRREVDEICVHLCCYAGSCGHFLPTFRDNLLVPSSGSCPWIWGPICFPETSGRNYHYSLRNNQEERLSNIDNLPVIFEKHKFHPNRIFNMEGTCFTTLLNTLPKAAAEQFTKEDSWARSCPQIVVNCPLFCSSWQVLQVFNSSLMIFRCEMNCVLQLQWQICRWYLIQNTRRCSGSTFSTKPCQGYIGWGDAACFSVMCVIASRESLFSTEIVTELRWAPVFMYTAFWNVTAHPQKPDFVFRRNGRVHLNRQGRQFSRLLAAKVCALAVVMLDTPCSEVVWRVLATHSIRQFPLHFRSRASPCAITFQLEPTTQVLHSLNRASIYIYIYIREINQQDTRFFSPFIPLNPSSTCFEQIIVHNQKVISVHAAYSILPCIYWVSSC